MVIFESEHPSSIPFNLRCFICIVPECLASISIKSLTREGGWLLVYVVVENLVEFCIFLQMSKKKIFKK